MMTLFVFGYPQPEYLVPHDHPMIYCQIFTSKLNQHLKNRELERKERLRGGITRRQDGLMGNGRRDGRKDGEEEEEGERKGRTNKYKINGNQSCIHFHDLL